MNKYEKPALKFVSLRAKENVAKECWSPTYNPPGKIWYYDPNGKDKGYCSFQVISSGDNCGQVEIRIEEIYNYPEDQKPTDKYLIDEICKNAGGNSGQPFSGKSSIQDTPGGMS